MELLGRDDDVAFAVDSLRASCSVVIEGEPGIGKSATLDEIAVRLRERRWDVELVRASHAARGIAFAPFSHLTLGGLPSQHPGEHLIRLSNELQGRMSTGRFALLIDDAQALDEMSLTLVHQFAARGGLIVSTARPDPGLPADLQSLKNAGRLDMVVLEPLSQSATRDLVRSRLGGTVDDALAAAVWRLSGGHPLFVVELVNAGRDHRVIVQRDRSWQLVGEPVTTVRLRELIEERITSVDQSSRDLLQVVAVAGTIPLDALVDRSADSLERLETADLVRIVEEPLRLVVQVTHELHRQVLLTAPESVLARARTTAIELLETDVAARESDDLIRAGRLRLANRQFDHDALLCAAELSLARFDVVDALVFAEGALVDRSSLDARLARAVALSGCGRRSESESEFRTLADTATTQERRNRVWIRHAHHAMSREGEFGQAVELLNRAVGSGPSCSTVEARGALAVVLTYGGDYEGSLDLSQSLLDEVGRLPLSAGQGMMTCFSIVGRPQDAEATWRRCVEASGDDQRTDGAGGVGDAVVVLSLMRLLTNWQLGRAGDPRHPMDWASRRSHSVVRSPLVRDAMTATTDVLRGHLERAVSTYRRLGTSLSTLPAPLYAFNLILASLANSGLGDLSEAERCLSLTRATPAQARRGFAFWESRAEVALVAARGDLGSAVARSLELVDRHRSECFHASVAVHDIVRFGSPELALERLERLAATTADTWWLRAVRAHAEAAVRQDIDRLLPVVDTFASGGLDLYAVEAACQASRLLPAGQDSGSLPARIAQMMAQCGRVTTPAVADVPRFLTGRELEVARLAASGASNKDIAARLGTSVRTVGNQLQHVYGKLGITGRTDLSALV